MQPSNQPHACKVHHLGTKATAAHQSTSHLPPTLAPTCWLISTPNPNPIVSPTRLQRSASQDEMRWLTAALRIERRKRRRIEQGRGSGAASSKAESENPRRARRRGRRRCEVTWTVDLRQGTEAAEAAGVARGCMDLRRRRIAVPAQLHTRM